MVAALTSRELGEAVNRKRAQRTTGAHRLLQPRPSWPPDCSHLEMPRPLFVTFRDPPYVSDRSDELPDATMCGVRAGPEPRVERAPRRAGR